MSVANPYAELSALLDTTRELTPEEMAELQLEQGYVDRALRIYDQLTAREPANASYATRREWLARMATVRPLRPAKKRPPEPSVSEARPSVRALPVRAVASRSEPTGATERTMHGIGPQPARVRRLLIIGVR